MAWNDVQREQINIPNWGMPQAQMAPVGAMSLADMGYGGGTGGGGFFDKSAGFGMNANTLNFGMQGLNTLGNVWGAWQSNKLAKDQLNFTKMITNTNLNNQIKSYNTALKDRSRSRAAVEGQTSAQAQAYVDENSLSRG